MFGNRAHPKRANRRRPGGRGLTAIEALASLTLSAALAVAVAHAAAAASRARATVQRHATGLLAASNALERLRAAEPRSLEALAEELTTTSVAGVPGARMEVAIDEAMIGGVAAREIVVRVFEQPGAAPLTLVGWHLESADAENDEASGAPRPATPDAEADDDA